MIVHARDTVAIHGAKRDVHTGGDLTSTRPVYVEHSTYLKFIFRFFCHLQRARAARRAKQ